MKKYVAGVVIGLAVVSFTMPVWAASYPVIGKTLKGENDSCPVLLTPYIAKTFHEVVGKADVRVELNYTGNSANITKDNNLGVKVGLEF